MYKLLKSNLSQAFLKALTSTQKLHCRTAIFEEQKQPAAVFCKKDVLRNFGKFTGKHLC